MSQKNKFFYGYASIFKEKDYNGDIILPESFSETQLKPESIPLFLEHNPKKRIGKIEKIKQDSKGLYVEGFVSSEFARRKKIPLSIGYISTFDIKSSNGVRYISKLSLVEISFVSRPANKMAFALCL